MKIFIITLLALSTPQIPAITVTCKYKEDHYFFGHGRDYSCDVQKISISSIDDRTVTQVNGDHLNDKSNKDVKLIKISDKTLKYFPKDFEKFFENIEMIAIFNSKLKQIQADDLTGFKKLEILWMELMDIEELKSGTFSKNPLLEFIAISSNKIKHVDFGVFDNLTNLNKLYFEFNPCHSRLASDRSSVVSLIGEINEKCKDEKILRGRLQGIKIELIECHNDVWEGDGTIEDAEVTVSGVEKLISEIERGEMRLRDCEGIRGEKNRGKLASGAGGSGGRNLVGLFVFLWIYLNLFGIF